MHGNMHQLFFMSKLFGFIKSSLSNFTSKGIFVLLSNLLEKSTFFFVTIIIARNYSESVFGFITASFAFANIAISFFEFGFHFYIQRESAANNPSLADSLVQTFSLRVFTFVLYLLLLFGYYFAASPGDIGAALLLGVSVFIYSINNLLNAYLFGKDKYRTAFYSLLLSRVFLFASVSFAVFIQCNITVASAGFAAGGLLHTLLLIRSLQKSGMHLYIAKPDRDKLSPILSSSFPLALSVIFVWLYDRGDVLLLRHFQGDVVLAIYAVAYSIYKLPQSAANFLFNPMFTEFSREYAEHKFLAKERLTRNAFALVLVLIPLLLLLLIGSSFITVFLYGSGYREAANYLPWLLIAVPALFGNNFTGLVLNAARYEKKTAKTVIYSACINISLNLVFIPLYGVLGCVVTTIITEYFTFISQIFYIVKQKIVK